ncbi:YihY/virulence factor BrkB family protein [Macrococcoides bohemicum]|uniref:YihY/virulence factor BrkB family protein n=1 Tax=Macrococcoides bohemicum TaxID=1903056 RepID=UPI0010598E0A|nr:YihY/virulence factor BrkB family protein [Macrococcus bohemicus]MBC9875051.1 YihY/virulence factor BrkB family protein [Macrococcus bohemicus]TDL33911.1 YihY/virulence factor BrkB family protein [Macrococcus bohemicus]
MSKDKKNTSKFLTQAAKGPESNNLEAEDKNKLSNKDEYYVNSQRFKSKQAKKENETLYVSKINKPAKYKHDGNFLNKLLFRIGKDDAAGLSAQLAYYFLLSLFPMLIFLLTLIPLFNVSPDTITNMIAKNAPGETSKMITEVVTDVMKNANGGLLSFGLIAALWSASNGMTALMNAFNVSYEVEDARNPIVAKLLSVLFTVVMVVVFGVALALPVFGEQIGNYLFGQFGLESQFKWVFSLIKVVLPLIITFIVFVTLYAIAPNVKLKFKSVIPGALFATIVWIGASFLFGYYVSNFGNYSKTYGSIGGVIVLMLWLYLTGFIIIIGAQINAIIHEKKLSSQQ